MNFNATNFEGFVVSPNNEVPSIYTNRARTRSKFFDAQKRALAETIVTQGVGSSHILHKTPNVAIESQDRPTLYELLPPPPVAKSDVGSHQPLEGGNDELNVPIGFDPFSILSNPMLRSNNQQQQHVFSLSSSIEPEVVPFLNENVGLDKRINFQGFTTGQLSPSSNKGYESESLNLNVAVEGTRGALTEFQLMELHNQKMIYSYINANMLVPPDLLNQSLCSHCFTPSSTNPTWGNLRQVFSGIYVDPELGRCRRSDGKKWRCANEAVADEKYCEKHRNRGRIRQRFKNTARGRKARPVIGNAGTSARPTEPGTSTLGSTETGVYFKSLVHKK